MNKFLLIFCALAGAATAQTPTPTATPAPPAPKVTWADTVAKADAMRISTGLLHLEAWLSEDSSLGARRAKLLNRVKAEGLTAEIRAKCEAWQTDFLRATNPN